MRLLGLDWGWPAALQAAELLLGTHAARALIAPLRAAAAAATAEAAADGASAADTSAVQAAAMAAAVRGTPGPMFSRVLSALHAACATAMPAAVVGEEATTAERRMAALFELFAEWDLDNDGALGAADLGAIARVAAAFPSDGVRAAIEALHADVAAASRPPVRLDAWREVGPALFAAAEADSVEWDAHVEMCTALLSEHRARAAEPARRREAIAALFPLWDLDASGCVDADEMRAVLAACAAGASRRERQAVARASAEVGQLSRGRDLDEAAFVRVLEAVGEAVGQEEFASWLARVRAEVAALAATDATRARKADAAALFAACDTDGSGDVDARELAYFISRLEAAGALGADGPRALARLGRYTSRAEFVGGAGARLNLSAFVGMLADVLPVDVYDTAAFRVAAAELKAAVADPGVRALARAASNVLGAGLGGAVARRLGLLRAVVSEASGVPAGQGGRRIRAVVLRISSPHCVPSSWRSGDAKVTPSGAAVWGHAADFVLVASAPLSLSGDSATGLDEVDFAPATAARLLLQLFDADVYGGAAPPRLAASSASPAALAASGLLAAGEAEVGGVLFADGPREIEARLSDGATVRLTLTFTPSSASRPGSAAAKAGTDAASAGSGGAAAEPGATPADR